jgi:H+/Cl- antiporter ClcA
MNPPKPSLRDLLPALQNAGIGAWIGVVCGLASALFLRSLEWATKTREGQPWLIYALPAVGILIVWGYRRFGERLNTDLLLERVHDPEGELPVRMAPMVLLGTVLTHLFGGSAGREGTALQLGGSLGLAAVVPFRLTQHQKRLALMAGLAGGFGSVFGTPLAGAVFGMEVLAIGRVDYDGLVPCFVASVVGDLVCRGVGIDHGTYVVAALGSPVELAVAVAIGAACALGARAFVWGTENWSGLLKPLPWWSKPIVGGTLVVLGALLLGHRYLGLGLNLLPDALSAKGSTFYDGPLKLLFTAVTLGSGFKGGEVTPLFVSGAAIGSWIGRVAGVLPDRMAAAGFVALFGAAANVPVAAWLMAVERFGTGIGTPAAVAVVVAYVLSGHRGIYRAQKLAHRKR